MSLAFYHEKSFGTKFEWQKTLEKLKAMRPFDINFDFPVASSNLKISLTATAELHHSEPYYVVHDFYLADNDKLNKYHSVLPIQEVKRMKRDGSYTWVHKDSEKTSELSIAIGQGIEKFLSADELEEITIKDNTNKKASRTR